MTNSIVDQLNNAMGQLSISVEKPLVKSEKYRTQPCRFHDPNNHRYCKHGDDCTFYHYVIDRSEKPATPACMPPTKPCKFFDTPEKCSYGSACRYRHSMERVQELSRQQCPHFLQRGQCWVGSACHMVASHTSEVLAPPCHHYINGYCRNGVECLYTHPTFEEDIEAPMVIEPQARLWSTLLW